MKTNLDLVCCHQAHKNDASFLGYMANISAAQGLSNPLSPSALQSSYLEPGCLAPLTFCWRSAECLLQTAAFLSDGDPAGFTEALALFRSSAWRECWHGLVPFMGWHRTPVAQEHSRELVSLCRWQREIEQIWDYSLLELCATASMVAGRRVGQEFHFLWETVPWFWCVSRIPRWFSWVCAYGSTHCTEHNRRGASDRAASPTRGESQCCGNSDAIQDCRFLTGA